MMSNQYIDLMQDLTEPYVTGDGPSAREMDYADELGLAAAELSKRWGLEPADSLLFLRDNDFAAKFWSYTGRRN